MTALVWTGITIAAVLALVGLWVWLWPRARPFDAGDLIHAEQQRRAEWSDEVGDPTRTQIDQALDVIASEGFTPTTSTVRDAYVYATATSSGNPDLDPDSSVIEFQRWLARHDAAVLRNAALDAESDADSDDHNPTTMRVYRAWSQWLKDRADHIDAFDVIAEPDRRRAEHMNRTLRRAEGGDET